MDDFLILGASFVVFAIGAIAVCALSNREASGMPAVARNAAQWALRRTIGARRKQPRHRTTTAKGAMRHV